MSYKLLYGAIAGDIIGSRFEHHPHKSTSFLLINDANSFTDDTVLTIAIADAILNKTSYHQSVLEYGKRYPNAGYGKSFIGWLNTLNPQPYGSYGNGSAMRVSPIGWAFSTEADVLSEAAKSAAITHDHPFGIAGAQAVALSIFLARTGSGKEEIRAEIEKRFNYDLSTPLDKIRPAYSFDVTCQGSVPQAIRAFLESQNVEEAIRNSISLGGDSDTQACIAGAIAEAFYMNIPNQLIEIVEQHLPADFKEVLRLFHQQYSILKAI